MEDYSQNIIAMQVQSLNHCNTHTILEFFMHSIASRKIKLDFSENKKLDFVVGGAPLNFFWQKKPENQVLNGFMQIALGEDKMDPCFLSIPSFFEFISCLMVETDLASDRSGRFDSKLLAKT